MKCDKHQNDMNKKYWDEYQEISPDFAGVKIEISKWIAIYGVLWFQWTIFEIPLSILKFHQQIYSVNIFHWIDRCYNSSNPSQRILIYEKARGVKVKVKYEQQHDLIDQLLLNIEPQQAHRKNCGAYSAADVIEKYKGQPVIEKVRGFVGIEVQEIKGDEHNGLKN